ncbi:Pentatricopeptide repeat-containing protein At3g61360 [Linum perenne]
MNKATNLISTHCKRLLSVSITASFSSKSNPEAEKIARMINNHPFPEQSLLPALKTHIPQSLITTTFIEELLGRLFAAHCNGLKALELFRFCQQQHPHFVPSTDSFEKTLHILARMRYFEKAWELMEEVAGMGLIMITNKAMSILLSKVARFRSYEETIEAFERLERIVAGNGRRSFGTDEFNVLIRAFCTQREMKEARSVFMKYHDRFAPDAKTMNILLLGFKESGDISAMELFYHEMMRRKFQPTGLTYSIRIDAYCKKGQFGDALRIFDEMQNKAGLPPSLETLTTLIHGAGIARNIVKAKELFSEIENPDVGAYNALICTLIKCRELKQAMLLMNKMEEVDNVTYHTLFVGSMNSSGVEAVIELYEKMVEKGFVPKARTSVMLMKFFCVNGKVDFGLRLWEYLMSNGQCPHGHALDILVTGLCSRGRLGEALDCSVQFVERGMRLSESAYRMMRKLLEESGGDKSDEWEELNRMIKRLHSFLPHSKGHALGNLSV